MWSDSWSTLLDFRKTFSLQSGLMVRLASAGVAVRVVASGSVGGTAGVRSYKELFRPFAASFAESLRLDWAGRVKGPETFFDTRGTCTV